MSEDKYVDLHLHTTASDGNYAPKEVVKQAAKLGFSSIAITDHDTVEGIDKAIGEAKDYDLEIVPGIELNTDYKDVEIHILGYYINYQQPKLNSVLKDLKKARRRRVKKIIARLEELGIEISFKEIIEVAGNSALGRSHIAHLLLEKGYINSWSEAFDKYIGSGKPAYVKREKLGPKEAIKLIQTAGGIPIVAHPGLIGNDDLLPQLIDWGAKGIEVYHTEHNLEEIKKYRNWAESRDLLITGGSDCHGPKRKDGVLLGQIKVPCHFLKQLEQTIN